MSFVDLFADDVEPADEPEPPVEQEQPDWLGPPTGELGAAVPLGLVLGKSERGGIATSHALVYSTGVSFELLAHVGGLKQHESHRIFHEQHAGAPDGEEPPDGFIRFGIELPDGSRVSNLGSRRRLFAGGAEPTGPVLLGRGGSGGQSSPMTMSWHHSFWLWPLPAPGRLALYCEWPLAEIEISRTELDGTRLLAVSSNVTRLWEEEGATGAWTSNISSMSMSAATATAKPDADRAEELAAIERALTEALKAVRRLR